jgi:hypothetical protein
MDTSICRRRKKKAENPEPNKTRAFSAETTPESASAAKMATSAEVLHKNPRKRMRDTVQLNLTNSVRRRPNPLNGKTVAISTLSQDSLPDKEKPSSPLLDCH